MRIAILTLPLTCFGQMFEKFSSPTGKYWAVFTPPKAGTSPLLKEESFSFSERCSDQGFLTSYPQPGSLGDLNGTRKCYDYCYSHSFKAALCLRNSCMCLRFNPADFQTVSGLTLFIKVSASGKDWAVFTPPKRGTPNLKMGKGVSVSERCSDQGFLTSYPQPGTLGDLNGTRKCYDYCYSHSYKAAVCQKHYCKCLAYNPTFMPTVSEEDLSIK